MDRDQNNMNNYFLYLNNRIVSQKIFFKAILSGESSLKVKTTKIIQYRSCKWIEEESFKNDLKNE